MRCFTAVRLIAVAIACSCSPFAAKPVAAGKPVKFMMRARVDGRMLEGQPLSWSDSQMLLLGRDGRLYEFDPRKAKDSKKTAPRFAGFSMSEMKAELYREFGRQLDLTTTQHYIVAHPRGRSGKWADRFESLYRSFGHYFRIRGFRPTDPDFPLIAIVFRNLNDYRAYAALQGSKLQPGTLGHYEPQTNRVFLFDVTSNGGDWTENAETIIHEATHQTAFNTGIHTRFTGTPRWLVEGLATMFESRGVWNSQSHQTQKDRINRGRLDDFHDFADNRRKKGFLQELIASDAAFRSDPAGAYAEAWALSFYLCETQPRRYTKYLALTADRERLYPYAAAERVADFQSVFGKNLRWIEAQFLKYMATVK